MAYPPTPYPPNPGQPAGPGYPPARRTNTMALTSLIAGIVAWVALPLLAAVAAVITGHLAQGQLKRSDEEGAGMAIAGLVLGYLNLLFSLLFACFFGTVLLGCLGTLAGVSNLPTPSTTVTTEPTWPEPTVPEPTVPEPTSPLPTGTPPTPAPTSPLATPTTLNPPVPTR
jgi:hypothetical protein